METPRALHFGTPGWFLLDTDATFGVRAVLSTQFEEQCIQRLLSQLVPFLQVVLFLLVDEVEQIQSVDQAPFVRVVPFPAVQTEHEFTVLTLAEVLVLL